MALNLSDSAKAGDLAIGQDGNDTMQNVMGKLTVKNRIGATNPFVSDSRGNKTGTIVDEKGWSK